MNSIQITEERVTRGNFNFEVDAGLISELGERLVARPSIALSELIKNSYDADATKVRVLLQNVSTPNGTIIVEDNGSGMTFEVIRDQWMRIATTDKINNPVSPKYGRARTGAKGVGRFAVGRLANKLFVHSVAQGEDGSKEQVYVGFYWHKDFEPGHDLRKIPIHYERKTVPDETNTGVTLLLEDLKDQWSEGEVSALRRDLLGLVNPFGYSEVLSLNDLNSTSIDPGFSVILEVPEFPDYEGELSEYVMAGAWATLTGEIKENGDATYAIEIHDTGETITFKPSDFMSEFRQLVGVSFIIHHFVYESKRFRNLDYGVRDAMRYARRNAGVRIYLDNFRAFGYGEPGNDWLGLDELRAQRVRRPNDLATSLYADARDYELSPFLRLPGNNQLFGAIRLSQSRHSVGKHGIQINIARDRLVENQAFEKLRTFIRNGIYWLTIQYARVEYSEERRIEPEPIQEPVRPIAPKLAKALQPVEKAIRESSILTTAEKEELADRFEELRTETKRIDAVAEELERQRISEISMLRVLASIGTMVSFLNHQLRAIIDNLGQIITLFEIYAEKVDGSIRDNFLQNIDDLRRWQSFVAQQVNLLIFLLGRDARLEQQPQNVRKAINDVANALQGYQDEYGIVVKNKVPTNLMSPPMYLAELYAIIINIFTNALKAVRGSQQREIEVRAKSTDREIYIQMLDSGKGLDIDPDKAFLPFETTSLPDSILGEGTGLGLYVVRALVSNYNGSAHFIDAPTGWRTCIEIKLPRK